MHIYIPSKNKKMYIPNTSNFEQFTDTMSTKTEYFLVSSDYFTSVDSLVADVPSDLRNPNNGADYIIIPHNKFKDIANQLADFRSTNFPDENFPSPRIKIVYVEEIYDEFSYGLLEPSSIRSVVQYAFENWELPAPSCDIWKHMRCGSGLCIASPLRAIGDKEDLKLHGLHARGAGIQGPGNRYKSPGPRSTCYRGRLGGIFSSVTTR